MRALYVMMANESQVDAPRRRRRGFAKFPHDFTFDVRLSNMDVRVLLVLQYYAKHDPCCYPTAETIGKGIGKKVGAVRLALRNLEYHGYIQFEPDGNNRTGRHITLLWTTGQWPHDCPRPGKKPPREPRKTQAETCRGGIKKLTPGGIKKLPYTEKQDYREGSPVSVGAIPNNVSDNGDDDHVDLDRERMIALIRSLPETPRAEKPAKVRAAAHLITLLFDDRKYFLAHCKVFWRVAKGQWDPEMVVEAFLLTYDAAGEKWIGGLGPHYCGVLKNLLSERAKDEVFGETFERFLQRQGHVA